MTVQTFQMALLLLFETTDELSCKELRDTLQLSAEQFQKHAASLVDCKLLLSDTEVTLLELVQCIYFLKYSYVIIGINTRNRTSS